MRFTCSITGSNLILTLATLTCISLASYEYVPVGLLVGQKEKGNRPPPQPLSPAGGKLNPPTAKFLRTFLQDAQHVAIIALGASGGGLYLTVSSGQ